MEDAGTLALLLKRLCINEQGDLDLTHFGRAVKIYEAIRIPRVKRKSWKIRILWEST
jgi:hypothetical protein